MTLKCVCVCVCVTLPFLIHIQPNKHLAMSDNIHYVVVRTMHTLGRWRCNDSQKDFIWLIAKHFSSHFSTYFFDRDPYDSVVMLKKHIPHTLSHTQTAFTFSHIIRFFFYFYENINHLFFCLWSYFI